MPTKEQIKESLISFAEDKGYIFWAVVYHLSVVVIAFFEQIFGTGSIFDYIIEYKFRFILLSVFAGSILDYLAKANVEVTSVRNKFIFRPPRYLRSFRRWTDIFLVLSFIIAGYLYYRWPEFVYDPNPVVNWDVTTSKSAAIATNRINVNSFLPLITLVTGIMLCLIWSIMGLFITEDDMKDKRIKYFMDEMRVSRIKRYQKASAVYIAGLFIASAIFYKLVSISGLWFYIYHSRVVYDTVTFFKTYFGWVNKFID